MSMEGPNIEIYNGGVGTHLGAMEQMKEKLDQIETELLGATGEQKEKLEQQKQKLTQELEMKRKETLN